MADDYAYAGEPDISQARFRTLLETAGSPGAAEADVMYGALVRRGVRPATFLAHWNHESNLATNPQSVEVRYGTRNPGAVRSPQNPEHGGQVIETDRGAFVRYASYELAAADWADRIRGPKYEGDGLTTVRQVVPRYAPTGDQGNQPVAYIASVLGFISRHAGQELPMPTMPPLISAILPQGASNRPGQRITMRFFTCHETANYDIGASARMHRNYVFSGGGPGLTSYTYVTDHLEAYNLIPVGESSNHAGTAQGNLSGYSMELCVNFPVGSPEWRKTQDNALAIIAHAYATTPTLLPVEEGLVPHRHWRNTACPARLTGAAWDAFRSRAIALVNGQPPSTNPLLDAEYARLGGAAVLGGKVVKAHLAWTVDWGAIDHDVLLTTRSVVSVAPGQTETAQRMFTDKARESLEAAGVLRPYQPAVTGGR